MKIEYVKIEEIENHPRNPKQHPDKQIRLIQKSIEKFGWTNPVLLSKDGVILAGHARVKAAIESGMDEIPAIRTDLSGKEADAYLLADNRLSDIAPYDRDILAELLSDLPQNLAELTGFEPVQVDSLLSGNVIRDSERFISDTICAPQDPVTEWTGMPEFHQEDRGPKYKIIVNFESVENRQKFAELVGRTITDKTVSIWYPHNSLDSPLGTEYTLEDE